MKIRRTIAAVVGAATLCLFATAATSQTINFGATLPAGPVPAGYGGFSWGTGANAAINSGPDAAIYYLTNPAASIVEFSAVNLFDLNSVEYQLLMSGITYGTTVNDYTTVVSGYRGTTLVKSVTEQFAGAGGALFAGLNIDGVNRITFSTTDTSGYLDSMGHEVITTVNGASQTFVDQLKVSSFTSAPEIDPPSAASMLTLLLGGLAILLGRRSAT
jgi:hypothetical protein